MNKASRKPLLALAAVLAAVLVPASSASAVELQGPWAPFDKCPVDDPQMLEVQNSGNGCISSVSEKGSFKIRDRVIETGRTELQFGATGPGIPDVIPPGSLQADPVKVPGGLLNMMCPGGNQNLIKQVCDLVAGSALNRVNATVELAGAVQNFNLFAPLTGGTVVEIPIKIHLENPLLGGNCYIGSDANPIVLRPHQDPLATGITFEPDPLGSQVAFIGTTPSPATLVDDTLEIPGAKGCGLLNLFDRAINNRMGLPSPSGENAIVLEEAVAIVAGNAPTGQDLRDAWHNAVIN